MKSAMMKRGFPSSAPSLRASTSSSSACGSSWCTCKRNSAEGRTSRSWCISDTSPLPWLRRRRRRGGLAHEPTDDQRTRQSPGQLRPGLPPMAPDLQLGGEAVSHLWAAGVLSFLPEQTTHHRCQTDGLCSASAGKEERGMTTTRHNLSVQQAPLRRLSRATGTATPDQQPFPLPASSHSLGHCAGLHPEDQPSQSGDFPCVAPLSGHTGKGPRPTRQCLGHLATIGYCQAGAQAVIRALLHRERWLLVDIRLRPWSYFPQWLGRTLAVQFAGRYLHLPALGQVHEGEAATQPTDLADAQSGVRHLVSLLEVGYSCLLLCGCPR